MLRGRFWGQDHHWSSGSSAEGGFSFGGGAGPALPGEAVPACRPPEGAPEEVARAIQANEAAVREVLQLRHISLASSGVGEAEPDVDPDYLCPICLVRALETQKALLPPAHPGP